ncbi:archaeal ribosomal protein L3 [Geoglobus ahangari]|uniref:Large ribosomal subunit protein uL3 n=1 Tax=Geoglobus ahangari TaxID=113653 RepID=A0A0F7IGB2_9EURY|nr:50S ribosomal protein L3 [Geoglobus ahangari]AKG92259.1 archaeal ribosomal protein L3 [Geoglobus ahangari]NOY11912.1 50S ribosomal protein L3 [Archaeoglobi archaeon]
MKEHRPRRGSLGFSPRKRASSIIPRIRAWPVTSEVKALGFAGYKAGMTHVVMVDDRKNSPTYGEEIVVPVTVIETPPLKVMGVRVYRKTQYGLQIAGEVWATNLDEHLARRLNLPKNGKDPEELKQIEDIAEVRLITYTQPYRITGVPKKVPDVMEQKVGGDAAEALDYAISKLGGEIKVSEVFGEGAFIDVLSITKGKGFQGPVKRWGVITLNAKHARSSKHRRVGTLGPWNPHHVRWTVPQAGQMGFHQRTEYNKRILKIGENGEEITPDGGFPHYGVVRNEYVLVAGSVPGPVKRLVRMRDAIRPPFEQYEGVNLIYVSTSSKQGR